MEKYLSNVRTLVRFPCPVLQRILLKDQLVLCVSEKATQHTWGYFPASGAPGTLAQVALFCQSGQNPRGWDKGSKPAVKGHCLDTEVAPLDQCHLVLFLPGVSRTPLLDSYQRPKAKPWANREHPNKAECLKVQANCNPQKAGLGEQAGRCLALGTPNL